MEKVKLTNRCKEILRGLNDKTYKPLKEDNEALLLLHEYGFLAGNRLSTKEMQTCRITPKGQAYLYDNPKLKNPSIWDDKKYIITTSIAVLALVISIINSIITILYNG